jgi:hypothetical protein
LRLRKQSCVISVHANDEDEPCDSLAANLFTYLIY